MEGLVIKAYSGFYYVKANNRIWECSLRGRLKKDKHKVFAGDKVKIQTVNDQTGVIEEISPRQNILIRPPIANVDQVLIVFASRNPDPNLSLLDRMVVLALYNEVRPVICFNKIDLINIEGVKKLAIAYQKAGFEVLTTSAKLGQGVEGIRQALAGKTSVLAGPSGAGKSTLLNEVQPGLGLKTGAVSEKIGRGRHTTRHVELLNLDFGGQVADTPGFSTLDIPEMEKEDLVCFFPEMLPYIKDCKFSGCLHNHEPKCGVKEALLAGNIEKFRYNHYLEFLKEVTEKERRY